MIVILGNLRAARVNLVQNDYVAGLPAVSAFMGLTSVLAHDLGLRRWEQGVIPVLHDLQPSPGRTRPEMIAKRVSKKETFTTNDLPEDIHGLVDFSLVLRLTSRVDLHALETALIGRRLAGGVLFPGPGGQNYRIWEGVEAGGLFRDLPRGHLILPLEAEPVSFGDEGSFSPIAEAILPRKTGAGEPPRGYRVPLAIGYRQLHPPRHPPPLGARSATIPHVFAEPGVGVAELVSIRSPRVTTLDSAGLSRMFFRWCSGSRHITIHRAYNPDMQGQS